jgi:hypothetical protein
VPAYDRRTELARVLPLWPHELDDESIGGRCRILAKLRRALRTERRRGIAGHWTYDLARHAELLRVYRIELTSSGLRDVRHRAFQDSMSRLRKEASSRPALRVSKRRSPQPQRE